MTLSEKNVKIENRVNQMVAETGQAIMVLQCIFECTRSLEERREALAGDSKGMKKYIVVPL